MLKFVLRFITALFFIWALSYPFLEQVRFDSVKQSEQVQNEKVKKKEKPLHNVALPNFNDFTDVKEKKHAFFDYIGVHVDAENKKILKQRAVLEMTRMMVEFNEPLNQKQTNDVKVILNSYKLPSTINSLSLTQALRRVDVIPRELALIQAAKESAWGTSRFARIGLNFFGQWCYKKGCGMVPNLRNSDAGHEVAAFKSVRAAVNSYFKNINTHNAYKDLRSIRENLRRQNQPIEATKLTEGLLSYSERREAYVEDLNTMISQNRVYFNE